MEPCSPPHRGDCLGRGLLLLQVLLATIPGILVASWIVNEAHHGMDFQDESFALLVAEHPDEYQLLPTRIGYFLRPFLLACGHDIPLLRVFSYLLLATGLFLNFVQGRRISTGTDPGATERLNLFSLALVLASFSWIARSGTCRTLGYNQQTAVLLLFLSACVLAWMASPDKPSRRWSWSHFFTGFILTWLAMVKPSAVLLLAPVAGLVLLCLGYFKRLYPSLCVLAGAAVLLLPYFLLVESPAALTANLKEWRSQEAVLQSGHGLAQATAFAYRETLAIYGETLRFFSTRFMASLVLLACACTFFRKRIPLPVAAVCALVLLPMAATSGNLHAFAATFVHSFSGGFALAVSILCAALLTATAYRGRSFWAQPLVPWCGFLCLAAPLLYSFGSEVEFQSRAGGAVTLCLGMAILLADAGASRQGASRSWIPAACALLLAFYLHPRWQNPSAPPGTPPAWDLEGLPHLDEVDPAEFSTVLDNARKAGWTAQTEVLDLWGRYPGITYLLGGRSPVWPWYMSTYSGATKFTAYNLTKLPPERLARLWLLEAEPAQPHIPLEKMPLPGGFPAGYEQVGLFRFRENSALPWTHVRLWRPKPD